MITFLDLQKKDKKFIMAGPNVIESEEQILIWQIN
jgi:3-deoxy-D-manno-octulosonic acid (KDO) 8-phosphate synthase